MLSEAQIREFAENGFVNAGEVIDRDQVAALRERMHDVIAGRSDSSPGLLRNLGDGSSKVVLQVLNIWEADELFNAHIFSPTICGMTAELLGADVVRVWHDQVQYKAPETGGATNWHQDHPFWPLVEPADLITAWVALDDATIDNGCMWMVPRSHRWPALAPDTIRTGSDGFTPEYGPADVPPGEIVEPVPRVVLAGHVHFHHCLTWHGSPPNLTPTGRPAIAVHYMPGWTRYERKADHPMAHRVEVEPGQALEGAYFPTVWDHGPVPVAARPVASPS